MGNLLHYALVFLVVALIAAAVGFGGVAGFASLRLKVLDDRAHGGGHLRIKAPPRLLSVPYRAVSPGCGSGRCSSPCT